MSERLTRRRFLRAAGAAGALAAIAEVRLVSAGDQEAGPVPERPGHPPAGPGPAGFTAIDAYVERHLAELRIPGAALAIVHGDRVVHLRGFGRADPSGRAVTPQTPFNIASLTKSFTALAVMQLVEAGRVELDTAVQRYVPAFRLADPEASARITVRHLLNQTSGIPRAAGLEVLRRQVDADELVRGLQSVRPSRPPGTAYEYSNANYWPLGVLVERLSGESFANYLRAHILERLGMRQTFALDEEAREHGLAAGHRIWFGFPVAAEMPWHPGSLASGCLKTSAEDLVSYLIAHLNGGRYGDTSVLSPAGMEVLHAPSAAGRYAMGWHVGSVHGEAALFHNGGTANYDCDMMLLPERRWGIVLLKNAGVGANQVADPYASTGVPGIASLLLGKEPPPGPRLSYRALYGLITTAAVVLTAVQLYSLVAEVRGRGRLAAHARSRGGLARRVTLPALFYLIGGCALVFGIPAFAGAPLWVMRYAHPDLTAWLLIAASLLCFGAALRTWLGVRAFRVARRSEPGIAAPGEGGERGRPGGQEGGGPGGRGSGLSASTE